MIQSNTSERNELSNIQSTAKNNWLYVM